MQIILLFALIFAITSFNGAHCKSPEEISWTRDIELGRGFRVRWSHRDPNYLIMEMSAPVQGYVAVGFSPNGAMEGSDIVMGWVDSLSGQTYLQDMYAEGNTVPLLDTKSNYELLWAEETSKGTTIRFRRRWDTCDAEHDLQITEDTTRLIWAASNQDPHPSPKYHGAHWRGGKSVYLKTETHVAQFPDEEGASPNPHVFNWDVTMNNILVKGDTDTTYFCKIFKAPQLKHDGKHQIIGYKPILEPSNMEWIHHINFFECAVPPQLGRTADVFEQFLDHPGGACYVKNMPPEWSNFCITFPITWAVGADGIMFPDHGGIPLLEEHNGTTYFMLEVHYNNPTLRRFRDNSGMRLFVTDNTRPNDYGQVSIHSRFGQFQMIPPKQESFRTMSFCTSECTQNALPKEGITVTHAMLHAHFTARRLRMRHIRNGVELEPLAQDLHYDFNYQQTRVVSPPRKVYPGDVLLMECDYETMDRDRVTYGGTSTLDEMCQGYITYYPKIHLTMCRTQHEFHNFFDSVGIKRVEGEDALKLLQLPYKPSPNQFLDPGDDAYVFKNGTTGEAEHVFDVLTVTEPRRKRELETVDEFLNSLEWAKDNGILGRKVWKQLWEGEHLALCTGTSFTRIPIKDYMVHYPKYTPFEKPKSNWCEKEGLHSGARGRWNIDNLKFFSIMLFVLRGYWQY